MLCFKVLTNRHVYENAVTYFFLKKPNVHKVPNIYTKGSQQILLLVKLEIVLEMSILLTCFVVMSKNVLERGILAIGICKIDYF